MRVKSLMIVTIFSALLLVLMLACGDGSNEGDIYTTTGGSTDAAVVFLVQVYQRFHGDGLLFV